ncbi:redoxin domain-containing protein [Kaistella sp.]|uniref:redoxin domain-containing protein n=1 Tax=Kaistella sp. TaxID=2782235 RepID=UPI003C4971EB
MKIALSIFLTFMIFKVSFSQSLNYKINGTVKGFQNNSSIFLSDLSGGTYVKIDSMKVQGEKFQFRGKLKNKVTQFAIHTKDYTDRVSFWVENTPLVIVAEKGKFREAVINGSRTQNDAVRFNKILDKGEEKTAATKQFIKDNPTSMISAVQLGFLKNEISKESLSELFKALSPAVKKSIYGKKVSDYLLLSRNPQIGDKYIDFEEHTSRGKTVKLSEYNGKIILLDFWGTWCAPCIEELPNLVENYKEFNHWGFEILGVAADTKMEAVKRVEDKFGITWTNVSDLKGDQNKSAIIYGVTYYPTNFLIDRNGIIIGRDLTGDELKNKLIELLK